MPLLPDDAHNRALVASVHPPDWVNPVPGGRYNLVVIGAGTAGLVSAVGAASLGAKVAIVERHLMGGDCLNFGCVPSKGLLRAARAVQAVRDAREFGVRAGGDVEVDFGAAMERMRRLRADLASHDSARRLADLGVDVFLGQGRFVAPDTIEVGERLLRFTRAVVATGGRAAVPSIPGLAEVGFLTNETVFSLTELPRRLAVMGAGPIGCELAQAFRRFGAEVTLIGKAPRLLPREDPDAAAVVATRFEREGIRLALGAEIRRVEARGAAKVVVHTSGGPDREVVVDAILVAVGRVPNVESLGLEAAGVAFGAAGVGVDDRLRTTNARVYAAGDVCSAFKFTHAADAMARTVLQNALFFGSKKASGLIIPWCTYTDPEVAHVGLDADGARDRGAEVVTHTVPLDDVDRAVLDSETDGFARLHVERRTGRILGATVVASHAGDLIGEVALAMTAGIPAGMLSRTMHAYPTQAEAWKRLGDAWNRSRLTPGVRDLFERYLRWRR